MLLSHPTQTYQHTLSRQWCFQSCRGCCLADRPWCWDLPTAPEQGSMFAWNHELPKSQSSILIHFPRNTKVEEVMLAWWFRAFHLPSLWEAVLSPALTDSSQISGVAITWAVYQGPCFGNNSIWLPESLPYAENGHSMRRPQCCPRPLGFQQEPQYLFTYLWQLGL